MLELSILSLHANKDVAGRQAKAVMQSRRRLRVALGFFLAAQATIVAAGPPWPTFSATALTGESVSSESLRGRPALVIITPSTEAAKSTRRWVAALEDMVDRDTIQLRDVLAVNLPFFISADDAIGRARETIPDRFHSRTWLLDSKVMEKALGIPANSADACIVVLDENGNVTARVFGDVSKKRRNEIDAALP